MRACHPSEPYTSVLILTTVPCALPTPPTTVTLVLVLAHCHHHCCLTDFDRAKMRSHG